MEAALQTVQELEASLELLRRPATHIPPVLTINASGTLFTISAASLASKPASLMYLKIAEHYSGGKAATTDSDGNIFFDVSPVAMKVVVNVLRGYSPHAAIMQVRTPTFADITESNILAVAEHLGIDDLTDELRLSTQLNSSPLSIFQFNRHGKNYFVPVYASKTPHRLRCVANNFDAFGMAHASLPTGLLYFTSGLYIVRSPTGLITEVEMPPIAENSPIDVRLEDGFCIFSVRGWVIRCEKILWDVSEFVMVRSGRIL